MVMKKLLMILALSAFAWPVFSQHRTAKPLTRAQALNEKYCTALFATPDGVYFDMLDEQSNSAAISYLNILDWLQGRVAGLQVFTTRDMVRLPVIRNRLAMVYVDEVRVTYDYLNLFPVSDIAMVKVINGSFIGNPGAAAGAIAIYTIQGDEESEED
jgi:hypothetical protein